MIIRMKVVVFSINPVDTKYRASEWVSGGLKSRGQGSCFVCGLVPPARRMNGIIIIYTWAKKN